jgi:hypothetical protein
MEAISARVLQEMPLNGVQLGGKIALGTSAMGAIIEGDSNEKQAFTV